MPFSKHLPILERMFPEILDFTNNMMTKDLFSRDSWMPAINVKEHKKGFEIEVCAPGFTKNDFEVTISDDILTISAENKKKEQEKEENYSRRAFYYNSFHKAFTLPKSVDVKKKIKVNYESEILSIQLEKLESSPTKNSIERLHTKTQQWISKIEFIKIEQNFLKELLAEHIIGLCNSDNYAQAKLLLTGITYETKLGNKLMESIKEHKINLALLLENIQLKKENTYRDHQKLLKIEVYNYIENFKYIKEQVFELVLSIMKNEKEKKLLSI